MRRWTFRTTEVVSMACSGQPADYRDDELDLADDDPELDLDDLCDRDED
jgi:hypothetical protein